MNQKSNKLVYMNILSIHFFTAQTFQKTVFIQDQSIISPMIERIEDEKVPTLREYPTLH